MFAKTSDKTNTNMSKEKIKRCVNRLLIEFCRKYPDIKGAKRDRVKDIYFYSYKFGAENIPSDQQILNDLNENTVTSIHTYEYKYLMMKKNGKIDVFWKETEEPLCNISLSNFNNYGEFRSTFRGKVNEKLIHDYWEEVKEELKRINNSTKDIIEDQANKSLEDDKEYEEIIIPKIKKN